MRWARSGFKGLISAFAFLGVMASGTVSHALAADQSVDLKACKTMQSTQAKLIAGGIEQQISRGPEWAKRNLGAERLRQILKFIETDEILKFRCYRVFAAEKLQLRRQRAEAARRRGVKIPPNPARNPQREQKTVDDKAKLDRIGLGVAMSAAKIEAAR